MYGIFERNLSITSETPLVNFVIVSDAGEWALGGDNVKFGVDGSNSRL